jgi:hypothetical protein
MGLSDLELFGRPANRSAPPSCSSSGRGGNRAAGSRQGAARTAGRMMRGEVDGTIRGNAGGTIPGNAGGRPKALDGGADRSEDPWNSTVADPDSGRRRNGFSSKARHVLKAVRKEERRRRAHQPTTWTAREGPAPARGQTRYGEEVRLRFPDAAGQESLARRGESRSERVTSSGSSRGIRPRIRSPSHGSPVSRGWRPSHGPRPSHRRDERAPPPAGEPCPSGPSVSEYLHSSAGFAGATLFRGTYRRGPSRPPPTTIGRRRVRSSGECAGSTS